MAHRDETRQGERQADGRRRPTIVDVARRVGVSKGAVSLVFNGRPGISRETAERIREAAAELGWVPHTGARRLSQARALAIGIVIKRPPHLLGDDPFYANLIAGVEQVLAERDYALVLRVVSDDEAEASSYRRLAAEGRVDGFILTDIRRQDRRFRLITELGTPTVALGPAGRSCPFPVLGPDDRETTRALVRHLVELGHTRIAHVAGPAHFQVARVRRAAWWRAMAEAGLEPRLEVQGDFTAASGETSTESLLRTPAPPTAILYSNDLMAIAGLAVAARHGLRVPRDLSIAGYGDISLAAHSSPPLTTVRREVQAWSRQTAEALMALIEGGHVPRLTLTESQLVLRGSVGPPRGGSP